MDSKRKQEGSQLIFEVALSPQDVATFESEAVKILGKDLELRGFRKGKVPPDVLYAHFGPARIFSEAATLAVRATVGEVLLQEKEDVVGEPEITITKLALGNPVEFRMQIGLVPTIDLGNWRSIRVKPNPIEASEKEVDDALEWVRKSRATFREVLRPAARGDLVEIDFDTSVGGMAVAGGTSRKHGFILGEGKFVPGFEDQIVGMSAGEDKTFTSRFPDDWPAKDFAAQDATFHIKLTLVKERLLPDANDAFAQEVGKFPSLGALRDSLREGMLEEKKQKETRRIQTDALQELALRVPDDLPETLLRAQRERLEEEIRDAVLSSGLEFEEYLTQLGTSVEAFRKGLEEPARARAKSALVLRAIANAEGLEVSEEDVRKETQELLRGVADAAQVEHSLDPPALRSYAESRVRNRMALELITRTVTQTS